jgi:hypothetical protein
MIRAVSSAILLFATSQALANESEKKAKAPTHMSMFFDNQGNPLNQDGSKMDVAGSSASWDISAHVGGKAGANFAKTNSVSALEQIIALNVYRVQDLEIVFDVLTSFPAHCTCCLGKKDTTTPTCPEGCLKVIDDLIPGYIQ